MLSIRCFPWGGDYRPPAFASLACSPQGLLLSLWCQEKNPQVRYTQPNDPVYLDSCLEAFLACYPGRREYLNFEMNANGALLLEFGPERANRRRLAPGDFPGCYPAVTPFPAEEGWGVRLAVSHRFLSQVYGEGKPPAPDSIRGNFYKCGSQPEHYACWGPIEAPAPDFHRPEFFQWLDGLWEMG